MEIRMSAPEKRTFLQHLEELRKRLLQVIIAVAITSCASFFLVKPIFSLLKSRAEGIDLIFIEMQEMIGTYFKVCLFSGIALALPFIIYQLIMFIQPALTRREKKYLYYLLPGVVLAFAAGVTFGYFVLVPPAAHFLITFGSDIATPQIKVSNFISIMARLIFALGLCFEIPLITFFLSKIGVITPRKLSKYRKFAIVGAFALGAIITPTLDPINQSFVAGPLIVLYEVGILLAKIGWKKKEEKKYVPAEANPESED